MQKIVNAEEMKYLDGRTIREIGIPSAVLMERAALACAKEAETMLTEKPGKVLAVCGSGNNGGDGLACARILFSRGVPAEIYFAGNPDHVTEETARQMKICRNLGVPFASAPDFGKYSLIIDAIFGIGLSRPVSGRYAALIEGINRADAAVLAVDIPSGIAADTGEIMGCAVRADKTVTMQFLKPGLLLYPGASYAGSVRAADIGVSWLRREPEIEAFEKADLETSLPRRDPAGNKGTFGKVLVIAGSEEMAGAAYLSSSAALRSGAGMVRVLTVQENRAFLLGNLPEAMLTVYRTAEEASAEIDRYSSWADTIVCGPGMGVSQRTRDIVLHLLESTLSPVILDADALNILHGSTDEIRNHDGPVTVTPHAGEMSRLTGKSIAEIKRDPISAACDFACVSGAACVLKDARTVTASPDGSIYINLSGNSGMATAGSGDVLTGIIAALTAAGTDPYAAGALGAFVHGLAGNAARDTNGEVFMTATDIIKGLKDVFMQKSLQPGGRF